MGGEKGLQKAYQEELNKGIDNEHIIVHDLNGPYLMKKCNWPNLKLPEPTMHKEPELLDSTDAAMGDNYGNKDVTEEEIWDFTVGTEDESLEDITGKETEIGWSYPPSKKRGKKARYKKTVLPTRRSSRIPKMGSQSLKKHLLELNRKTWKQVWNLLVILLPF